MAFQIPDHGGHNTQGYSQDDSQFISPTQPSTSRTDRIANAPFNNQEIYSPTHVHDPSTAYERELPPLPDQPNQRSSYQQPARTWVNGSPTDGNGAARRGGGPDDEVVHVEAKPLGRPEVQENTTHRALDANQVTMITLGATFGTGLLVGSGTALYEGGPLGILIAFGFVGFICYCMMTSLCEMATFLPHKKGFVGFASRYIHPAVGFGLGWTYVFQFLFVPASHINTAAIVMEYSGYTVSLDYQPIGSSNPVPVAVWRLIFIILAVSINFLGIRGFGRFEFWLSSFKILVLIALIFFGIVVDLGGARLKPGHPSGNFDRLGFRYWSGDFGPMGHAHLIKESGGLNTFLGFWATMVRAWFSYMGIELLGVVVGEAANPRKSVPRAIKQTYRLVISLYMLNIFIIGLICPSNDRIFSSPDRFLSHEGQVSPFIIAANQLAARGLVPVINAAIIIFALSGATSNVYTASRILYGLALDKQAPSILRKVTAGGKPLLAIGIAMACCFFSYLGQDEDKTTSAFDYFVDLTTTAGAISWICILWSHIRFRGALKAQRYQMDTLRYLSPMYPYGTWFSLIATIIFTIFKGHESYQKRGAGGFVAAYILIPWFLFLTGMWKYFKNETAPPLNRIDLIEGKREVDLAEESYYQMKSAHGNPSIWDKIVARA